MGTTRLLLNGVLFGLGAAAPIGPVNVELARRALRSGFWAAVALGCGAVTVDVCYTVLAAIGVARILAHSSWIYWPVAIAGVGMLTFLGMSSLRGARSAGREHLLTNRPTAPTARGGYVTGIAMTATNPMTLAFWFTVLPALAGTITEHPRTDLPIICVGVFIGTIGWVLTFAGLLSFAGRFRKPWWMIAADEVGGAMLLALAGAALLRVFARPL
ncbi:MAG TPA: LysE family translocator [Tepidisphaeraceae bacterium]|jgi:threonine/homoserine/homoserine lactone efflux protein